MTRSVPLRPAETGPVSSGPAAPTAGHGLRTAVLAVVVGLVLGALTFSGQGHLPASIASAANSAGTWCAAATAVALAARSRWVSVLGGVLTLWFLEVGYVLGAATRGYASSPTTVGFWVAAGLLVGPLLGLAAHALRHGTRRWAGVAVGALAGLAVGEAVHGLTAVAASTAPGYWIGEIVVAVVLVVLVGALRLREVVPVVVAGVVAALVAVVFVVLYRLPLIGLVG